MHRDGRTVYVLYTAGSLVQHTIVVHHAVLHCLQLDLALLTILLLPRQKVIFDSGALLMRSLAITKEGYILACIVGIQLHTCCQC